MGIGTFAIIATAANLCVTLLVAVVRRLRKRRLRDTLAVVEAPPDIFGSVTALRVSIAAGTEPPSEEDLEDMTEAIHKAFVAGAWPVLFCVPEGIKLAWVLEA